MVIPQTEAQGLHEYDSMFVISAFTTLISINRFNIAEMGGMSRDIPHEALVLIKRMSADPRVKINEHWKVGSYFT